MAGFLALFAFFGFNPQTLAATYTWSGATDSNWADENWLLGGSLTLAVPGTGDTAIFNGAGNSNTTISLGLSGVTVGSMLFNSSSAAAYTIGSGSVGSQTLTLNDGGSITMNSTVTSNELFDAGIILGTDATAQTYTFTNNSLTNTLDFAGNITGGTGGTAATETLIIAGAGNTVFSGNLYKNATPSTTNQINLTKIGSGTLTVNPTSNLGSASGTVAVNDGTLAIDFTNAGANGSLLSSFSPLAMGGGTLKIIGNASNSSTQTFGGLTVNPGLNVITTSTNSAAAGGSITDPTPTLVLGAITQTLGSQTVFNGPAYSSAATVIAGGIPTANVASTGNITTTTAGLQTNLLWPSSRVAISTVGLYNWASSSTANGGTARSILSGDQVSGFYTQVTAGTTNKAAADANFDFVGSGTVTLANAKPFYADTFRFNYNAPMTVTTGAGGSGYSAQVGGILVTPNVGANNIAITNGGAWLMAAATNGAIDIYQNNTSGELLMSVPIYSTSAYAQAGAGTVVLTGATTLGGYTNQTYLNGGYTVINNNNQIGATATGAAVNLNGGTLITTANLTLANGTSNKRPITLLGNGGGLAAFTGSSLTVSGVISSAAVGSGPLIIGIPSSSANGNTAGLLPGTGPGTANTTSGGSTAGYTNGSDYANGTVILQGAGNSFYGGAIILGGATLNIDSEWELGGGNYGGLTFNNGTLQYNTTLAAGTEGTYQDITANSAVTPVAQPVTLAGAATIDTNGHSITYANPLGNNGSGSLTVASTASGGNLTLNGANTYTGTTTVGSGTLTLGGTIIGNVSNGATFSEGSGGVISGAGVTFTNTAGTATLGGANTYTGATTITSGTVNLSGGTIAGNISNGATFTENGAGVINGSGATFTNTAGTASLAGANTYGGGTTISGGTVNVTNGSGSATGSGGVALNGGTLAGNGIISGTVTVNGGLLAPGAPGTTLTLGGLTYNSGTLSFTLNGAGVGSAADSSISVTNALFNAIPTLSVSAINVTSISNNEVFTLLSSANTIGGSSYLSALPTITVGRYVLTPSDTGNNLILTANGSAANLVWAGGVSGLSTSTAPQGDGSTWNNTQTTSPAASNWNNGGKYDYFYDYDTVTFNDTATNHTVSLTTNNSPGSVTVNTASSYTFTGSGSITGPGAVTVQAGTLNLNTVNTYTGGTVISAPAGITAGVANALPGTGTVAVSGILDLGGYNQSVGILSDGGVSTGAITNGGSSLATLTTTGTSSSTYSGIIQDGNTHATALSVAYGTNTLTLSGANTYSGGTTLTSGTLLINNGSTGSSTASAIGTGALTINGGTINTSLSSLTLGTNNAINIGGNFTFGGTNNMNLGTGSVSITGSPTIALNGSGTALTLGGAASFTSNASASATVNGAGNTLNLGSLALDSGAATVTDTLGGSGNINISGAVTNGGAGANSLTYAGTGALTLAGGDSQTGAITVSSGILNLTGGTINGATSLTVANGAILNIAGASVTLPGASGSPALNFAVGNSNPKVFISSGSLTYGLNGGGDQNQAMQAGSFTQTGGTVSTDESDMAGVAGQTFTFYLGGTGSYSSGVGEYANFTVGTRGIANAYVDGSSTLTVSGGNANPASGYLDQLLVGAQYSGGTAGTREFVQQGGTVNTNGLSLGGFVAAAVNSPGVYYLNGGTLNTGALNRGYDTNANEGTGTLNFGGGTFEGTSTFATDAHVVTNINSGGAIIDVPTSDNVTWTGGITAGTTGNVTGVTLSNAGSGYTTAPTVTVSGGGGTGATAVAILNAAGQVTDVIITNPGSGYTSAPTFTFSAAPGSGVTATASGGTYATGNGGLTKVDSGTLTLAGANTYTGATNVNAGTLAFGSASSFTSPLFNVSGGATLDVSALSSGWAVGTGVTLSNTAGSSGTSYVNGTVVLNSGGAISAGTSATIGSTMDIGSLTLNSAGGNVLYSITDPTATTGSSSLIDVTGTLTINGGQIGITGATFNTGTSYNITYDLFQYAGSIAGAGLSALTVNPAEELNGLTYTFGASGGYVTLNISGDPTLISNWITDGNGSFASSGNWDNGVPNAAGDTAKFGGSASTHANLARTIQLNGNETVGEIDFSSPNGESYTITQGSSGNLILNNGTTAAVIAYTGTHTIDSTVPVELSSNLSVGSSNGSDSLTIAGVIANTNTGTLAATLTKTGPGVLALTNANTYGPTSAGTVGTNLNGGTLQVGNNASLGSGNLSFGSNATLQAGAAGLMLANNVVIASGGLTATVDTNGDTFGLSGVISDIGGAGALTVASTTTGGTLVLTNAETYGGATTINSGATLQLGNGSTSGSIGSTAAITDNGALVFEGPSSGAVTVSNNIGGTGSLTQASVAGNALTLSGSNTYSGLTTVSSGSLVLANTYALQDSVLNLSGGGASFSTPTAAIMVGLEGSQNLSLTNTGSSAAVALSLTGAGNYSYTGNLSGLGSVTMNGTGSAQIGSSGVGGASYAGGTTVNSGSLTISGTGTQTGPVTLSAGTLILAGNSEFTGPVILYGNGASTFTVENNAIINSSSPLEPNNGETAVSGYATAIVATIENNASVTVSGFSWGNQNARTQTGNSLTIANSASFIDNGSFDFLNDESTSAVAQVAYNLNGGTLAAQNFLLNNPGNNNAAVTLNLNTGTIEALASDGANSSTQFLPALAHLTANVTGGAVVNTNGFNVTIGQALVHGGSGTDGGLTVEGAGSLTLAATDTYNGTTTVDSGATLIVTGKLSATGSVAINGTLDLNAANALFATGHLTLAAGTLAILANETEALGDLTLGAGASTLSLGATGTVINIADSGADTWTGTLAITNWNGNGADLNGGGSDQVIFANDDLSSAQLGDITFVNPTIDGVAYAGSYGATELSNGELVAAVPEPGAWGMMLGGFGMLLVWQRSRRHSRG
jgi:autotransporter-associated beta strand protein